MKQANLKLFLSNGMSVLILNRKMHIPYGSHADGANVVWNEKWSCQEKA